MKTARRRTRPRKRRAEITGIVLLRVMPHHGVTRHVVEMVVYVLVVSLVVVVVAMTSSIMLMVIVTVVVDAAAVVAASPLPFVGARLSSPPRRRRPRHDYFIGARLLARLTIYGETTFQNSRVVLTPLCAAQAGGAWLNVGKKSFS